MIAGNNPRIDNEIISRVSNVFHWEYDQWRKKYSHQELGYNFLAGEQYTPDQISWYEAENRPTNSFNLIFPQFNQVLGNFYLNDQSENVFAQPGGTPEIAAIFRDLIDNIKIDNEFIMELGTTVLAGLIGGGYLYPRFSSEKHLDGSVVIQNLDEFEIMFDSRARTYFCDDAAYYIRSRWMTAEDIYHWWPQWRDTLKQFLRERKDLDLIDSVSEYTNAQLRHTDYVNEDRGKYRVIEFHEKPWKKTEVALNQRNGHAHVLTFDGKKRELFLRSNPDIKIVDREAPVKTVTTLIPGLNFILDKKESEIQDGTWDIVNYSAYKYGMVSRDNFGIFKNALGPQRDFNDARNRTLDIINKSANVGETIQPDAFLNFSTIENFGNKPGMMRLLKKDQKKISEVYKRDEPPKYPLTDTSYAMDGLELLQKITGITQSLQGVGAGKQEAASLFAQKVRQAEVSLVPTFVNLRISKNRVFDKTISLIQANYSSERYFLVTNPQTRTQKELYINIQRGNQVLNDVTVGRYKVFSEALDQNPTARHLRFMQKTEIVTFLKDALGPMAIDYDWWLEESDLGDLEEMKKRIRMVLESAAGQANQQEAMDISDNLMNLAIKKISMDQPVNEPTAEITQ